MSEIDSLNFGEDESLHIETPIINAKNNLNHHYLNNNKNNIHEIPGRYINVLAAQKATGKLILNEEFEELIQDGSTSNIKNVSFMGAKKIGKSFLLDSLLTLQCGQVRRMMSKNKQQPVNTPSMASVSETEQRIVYLDNNGQPLPAIFLWMYYVSSVIVYSLTPNNFNEESYLLECLVYTHNSLQPEFMGLPRPQLILIRRDAGKKEVIDIELIRKIQEFGLFEPDITVIHMPYPGNKDVMAKQLLDVPVNQLDRGFLGEVSRLHQLINTAKAKAINGHPLNSYTETLLMQALLKPINNAQQILNSKKIWNDVNESMSVTYYNEYLKTYSEQLEKQLASQQPYDKYGMYKKLSNVKRKVNKKMARYQKPMDQQIFQRYKDKLEETIRNKQMLVKNVNQEKSRQIHQSNYENLASGIDSGNFQQLIENYCKSPLDEQKTDVLLEKIEKTLSNNGVQSSNAKLKAPKTISPQEIAISNQIKELNQLIVEKSNFRNSNNTKNYQAFKSSLESKKIQLKALQSEYQSLINTEPHFILDEQDKNTQLAQLEQEKERLVRNIQNQEKQIESLRKQKQKVKETTMRLQQQLQREEQTYRRLNVDKNPKATAESKVNVAGKSSKKTCCALI